MKTVLYKESFDRLVGAKCCETVVVTNGESIEMVMTSRYTNADGKIVGAGRGYRKMTSYETAINLLVSAGFEVIA